MLVPSCTGKETNDALSSAFRELLALQRQALSLHAGLATLDTRVAALLADNESQVTHQAQRFGVWTVLRAQMHELGAAGPRCACSPV